MSALRRFSGGLGSTRRDEEEGAVLAMTAFLTVVIIAIAAFAVDLGLQRSAIRDMQAVADAAALDAARLLPTQCNDPKLTTTANASSGRQKSVIGGQPDLTVEAGNVNDGVFVPGPSTATCTAVRVTSATTVARVFAAGDGGATRSAVATQSKPQVCFSVGTKTLTLTTSGALGPILDHILHFELGVVGYEGLAKLSNLSIPLADLKTELGIGTADELLTSDVRLGQLVDASVRLLQRQGDLAFLDVDILNKLLAVGGQIDDDVKIVLGDVLDLGTGGDQALSADVHVLDLLGAAIVASNGSSALAVQGLNLGLPGDLVNAASTVSIIEPPVIACGTIGAKARTAQVRVGLDSNVSTQVLAAAGLNIAGVHLGLAITAGLGEAELGSLNCPVDGTSPSATMKVKTAAATIAGHPNASKPALEVRLLGSQWRSGSVLGGVLKPVLDLVFLLTGYPEIKVTAGLATNIFESGPTDRVMMYQPEPAPLPSDELAGSSLKVGLTGTKVTLANGGVLGIVDSLVSPLLAVLTAGILEPLLNSVVSPLLSNLVTPLLKALGVELGVTEVKMLGRPSCENVQLIQMN